MTSYTAKKRIRLSFGKQATKIGHIEHAGLLDIQKNSYKKFLQADVAPSSRPDQGLHAAFKSVFPISSFSGYAVLEYVEYKLGEPVFDVKECQMRSLTYAAPLRVKARLIIYDKEAPAGSKVVKDIKEQDRKSVV